MNYQIAGFILIALFLILAFMISLYFSPAYAMTDDSLFDFLLKIYSITIQNNAQNEQIIEKLDWNNCAISHKSSFDYGYENTWKRANSYSDLVEKCGVQP